MLTLILTAIYKVINKEEITDHRNSTEIPLKISEFGFVPGKIKISARKSYTVGIKKSLFIRCSQLILDDLQIRQEYKPKINLFVYNPGNYALRCSDSHAKLEIEAE